MTNKPVSLKIADIDEFIKKHSCLEVSSGFRMDPTTGQYHAGGLYSELIFGDITSPDRMRFFGYIDLHTKIIHPKVFRNLIRLKRMFYGILTGDTYAIFDEQTKTFIKSTDGSAGAETGYEFFVRHLPYLKFEQTDSIATNNRIKVIENNRGLLLIDKFLVIPAGFRDYRPSDTGKGTVDEINKMYTSMLNLARAVNPATGTDPKFNVIRMGIQKKANQVYEYIDNLVSGPKGGKRGYLQGKFGARNLALGSRNVISATTFEADDVNDIRFHDIDHTKIPLIVALASFEPAVIYQLKRRLLGTIFNVESERVALIDPKTWTLHYVALNHADFNLFLTSDGIGKLIDEFKSIDVRNSIIEIPDVEGNKHYLYMMYDNGDEVHYFRSLPDFEERYERLWGTKPDRSKMRPMRYVELMYAATYMATVDKYVNITRYPAIQLGSSFTTRVYITTTNPARKITMRVKQEDDTEYTLVLPDYPVIADDATYVDSTQVHPSRLPGLGGDYDGDTVNNNSIMNLKSIEENDEHIDSPQYLLEPNGGLSTSLNTDVIKLVLFNMTRSMTKK